MKLTENTKVRVKVPKHLYEAIQAELDKKHGMEEGEEMNEYVGMSPDQAQVAEILGTLIASGGLAVGIKTALQMALDKIKSKKSGDEEKGDINEYVGMSPDQAQVVEILGSLIAAGGLGAAVKTALQMALDKIKSKKSGDVKEPVAEVEEMEEALDFNTLMEAVKDASKKKAEDKKKKELEAKKKKAEDDKKKKEAEAKKKVAAAKKK